MRGEAWDSGVAGDQCEGCGEFTIVRKVAASVSVDPFDDDGEWLCRPCYMGENDDYDEEPVPGEDGKR